jgi:hypothetical protein
MPFAPPTMSRSSGARQGTTALFGTLTPARFGSTFQIGASIAAYTPLGAIITTSSWGLNLGAAPVGTSTLIVAASGLTFERASVFAAGAYGACDAEIGIDIEERLGGRLVRAFSSAPTNIFSYWVAPVGFQFRMHNSQAATVFGMPVIPGRTYTCWITATQTASCSGVPSGGHAASNFALGFQQIFFDFAK